MIRTTLGELKRFIVNEVRLKKPVPEFTRLKEVQDVATRLIEKAVDVREALHASSSAATSYETAQGFSTIHALEMQLRKEFIEMMEPEVQSIISELGLKGDTTFRYDEFDNKMNLVEKLARDLFTVVRGDMPKLGRERMDDKVYMRKNGAISADKAHEERASIVTLLVAAISSENVFDVPPEHSYDRALLDRIREMIQFAGQTLEIPGFTINLWHQGKHTGPRRQLWSDSAGAAIHDFAKKFNLLNVDPTDQRTGLEIAAEALDVARTHATTSSGIYIDIDNMRNMKYLREALLRAAEMSLGRGITSSVRLS